MLLMHGNAAFNQGFPPPSPLLHHIFLIPAMIIFVFFHFPLLFNWRSWEHTFTVSKHPPYLIPNKVFSLLLNIFLWFTPNYLRWLWVFLHTAVLYPSIYVDFYQLSYLGSLFKSIGILLKTKEKNIMCRRQVL